MYYIILWYTKLNQEIVLCSQVELSQVKVFPELSDSTSPAGEVELSSGHAIDAIDHTTYRQDGRVV